MAANSPNVKFPVEYYLILKNNDNGIIPPNERPEIKHMLGALMSMGNDLNAIFKLTQNKQNYIFDTELLGTALAFKEDPNYTFEVSAEKPENASLYIRVRVNSDNICERISVVTEVGADYKVQSLSPRIQSLKKHLEKTFQRSNYQQAQDIVPIQIFPANQRIWASHKSFQEDFEKQQQLNIDAIATEDLPAMKTVDGDLIVGDITAHRGNPEVQSSITISYVGSSKKVIGLTLHQPGNEDIVFDTDDLDAINSSDDPMKQMASLIDARIIAAAIPTMAQAYHFYHMKGQSPTQFAYSDGFIVGPDVPQPYNFLINLKTKELRIHCKVTNEHVIIPNFNIDANLSVLIQQFHTAFLSLIGEETLKDPMTALDLLIYICKEVISSRKQSKDEMFAYEIKQTLISSSASPSAGADLFKLQNKILTPLKALVAKITRLRNVQPLNQDHTINFELILLLDEIASDIEEIDISEEHKSATANPILKMRDTLLQLYIEDILSTIENMSSDNDDSLKQQLIKITEALANLVKLEKINGYTAVVTSALPRPPERNIVYFIPEGEKIRFLVVDPGTNSPITSLLNRPSNQAERDSLLITTLEALSKGGHLPYEAVTHTIIRENINVLINLLWGYTLHPISELPAHNNKIGNKVYISKIQFGERYVVHMETGSVIEGAFGFNEQIDSDEFKDGINLDDSMAVLKFVAHRISKQMHSDIVIRSGSVIKESIVSASGQIAVYSPKDSSLTPAISVPKSADIIFPNEENSSPSAESSSSSAESSSSAKKTSFLSVVSRSISDKIRTEYDKNIEKITTPQTDDVAESHDTLKTFLNGFLLTLKAMLTPAELAQTGALIASCPENPQLLFLNSNIIHPQVIVDMTEINKKIFSPEAKASIRTVIRLLQTNQEQKIEALTTPKEEDVSLDKDYLNRFFAGFNTLITPEERKAVTGLIDEIKHLPYLLSESNIIHPQIIEMMVIVSEKISSPTAKTAICTVIKHLKTNQQNKLAEDEKAKVFDSTVSEFSRFLNSLEGIIAASESARSQEKSISADMNAKITALKKEIIRYLRFIEQKKWYLFGNIADAKKDFTAILDSIKQRLADIQNTKAVGLSGKFMAFISKDVEIARAARQEAFSDKMTSLATDLAKLSASLTGDPVSLLNPKKKETEPLSTLDVPKSDLDISASVPSADPRKKGRTLTIHSSMRISPEKVQPFSAVAGKPSDILPTMPPHPQSMFNSSSSSSSSVPTSVVHDSIEISPGKSAVPPESEQTSIVSNPSVPPSLPSRSTDVQPNSVSHSDHGVIESALIIASNPSAPPLPTRPTNGQPNSASNSDHSAIENVLTKKAAAPNFSQEQQLASSSSMTPPPTASASPSSSSSSSSLPSSSSSAILSSSSASSTSPSSAPLPLHSEEEKRAPVASKAQDSDVEADDQEKEEIENKTTGSDPDLDDKQKNDSAEQSPDLNSGGKKKKEKEATISCDEKKKSSDNDTETSTVRFTTTAINAMLKKDSNRQSVLGNISSFSFSLKSTRDNTVDGDPREATRKRAEERIKEKQQSDDVTGALLNTIGTLAIVNNPEPNEDPSHSDDWDSESETNENEKDKEPNYKIICCALSKFPSESDLFDRNIVYVDRGTRKYLLLGTFGDKNGQRFNGELEYDPSQLNDIALKNRIVDLARTEAFITPREEVLSSQGSSSSSSVVSSSASFFPLPNPGSDGTGTASGNAEQKKSISPSLSHQTE